MKTNRITGTLHEELCKIVVMCASVLLRMRNASDKIYRKNQNTFYVPYGFFEHRAVCEMMWENTVETDRRQIIVQYRACALHAGYLRLNRHNQFMLNLLLFHYNNCWTNYIVCLFVSRIFLSSLTVCDTSPFFTRSVQLVFSILLQHHISKFTGHF